MSKFQEGQAVYVRRDDGFYERASVDHCYVSVTGYACVSFTTGPNALSEDVLSHDEYWERQRAALEDMV